MKFIQDIKENETINSIYYCKTKIEGKTKSGKTYYSLDLQDKTGIINAKIWDITPHIENFEANDYIQVYGQTSSYQGNIQLSITHLKKARETDYNIDDYMPVSTKNRDNMYNELINLVNSVKDIYLNRLLKMFFVDDKDLVERIKYHSAAKSVHHGFIGGLLEHSLSVAKMCDYMASNYSFINRDLLITAALFHDIGKLEELAPYPINDYTEEGNYLGHIYMGAEKIGIAISKIPGFPYELSLKLKHCILSHHGELEYGSPKKPAIIEAVALNFADNTDAKLQAFTEILNNAKPDDTWLGFNKVFNSNLRNS